MQFSKRLAQFSLEMDLELPSGSVLALFGPSGCGKSMTLRCMAGLVSPDAGKIQAEDQVFFDSEKGIRVPARERGIGFLFQQYALFPHLTVEDNVAFGLQKQPLSVKRDKVQSMLSRMRLQGLEKRYPHQLSGGQQQRVALARTLVTDPKLLLLDEPFSALDSQVKSKLEQEVVALKNSFDGTMILVTHSLEEAFRLCSHVAVMEDGKILQFGSRESVIHEPANRTVARLVGTKNIFDCIAESLEGHGHSHEHGLGNGHGLESRPGYRPGQRPGQWIHARVDELGCSILVPFSESISHNFSIGIRPSKVNLFPMGKNMEKVKTIVNCFPAQVARVIEGPDGRTAFLKVIGNTTAKAGQGDYNIQAQITATDSLAQGDLFREGNICHVSFPPESMTIWNR